MRYADDLLDGLRRVGDPTPDRLIEELAAEHEVDAVNAVLHHLIRNGQPIPGQLPADIAAWLRDTEELPDWAEPKRIEAATELYAHHGVSISLILATSALLECYAARHGVKVLAFTYRLAHNAYRRVAETNQFVLFVMAPDGLVPGGQGVPAIQKVRLMHAAIRYLIRQSGRWSEQELGAPICQEDMLGTLMAFSFIVVRDLRKLGITVTDEQAEDYLHVWRVVGTMLGILLEHLPTSMDEAAELTAAIVRRHHGPSPEGVAMTRALLEFHRDLLPGELFQGLAPAVVRRLVGDQVADWLEVPRSHWSLLASHEHLLGHSAALVDRWGMALLTRKTIALGGYERAGFAIPTSLQERWGLTQAVGV